MYHALASLGEYSSGRLGLWLQLAGPDVAASESGTCELPTSGDPPSVRSPRNDYTARTGGRRIREPWTQAIWIDQRKESCLALVQLCPELTSPFH